MKVYFFIFIGIFVSGTVHWLTDFDQAKELANQSHKHILLNFSGSDWCAPCIKMKRDVFDTPKFQKFSDELLVLVRADFPRQKKNQLAPKQKEHNERLAEKYNPHGNFPLTLLLDANGKVIKTWVGYQGTPVNEFISEINLTQHD